MTAQQTVDDFVELVRKSKLVDGLHFDEYIEQHREAGTLPDQPSDLADQMIRDGLLTPFHTKHLLNGKWRGFIVAGKYKALDLLGAGGMGKVYLCEQLLLRRLVAVKVLPTDQNDNPAAVERFYREARAVAALDHPNMVRIFDVIKGTGSHCLIMEYVDGVNLQEFVGRVGPLSISRASHYVCQAALGLQHAHEAGLVHRDVKPANLFLDRNGQVKVLDMGLARFQGNAAEDNITQRFDERNILGTADYIAPEQALSAHEVDIRSDIYSLGATFYFLLSGQPPFADGTTAQKLLWHQMRNPDPVTKLRPDVPESIRAVLERMMAKSAADRFQTPADVVDALIPLIADSKVAPPTAQEIPPRSGVYSLSAPGAPETTTDKGPSSQSMRRTATPSNTPLSSGGTADRTSAVTRMRSTNTPAPAYPVPAHPVPPALSGLPGIWSSWSSRQRMYALLGVGLGIGIFSTLVYYMLPNGKPEVAENQVAPSTPAPTASSPPHPVPIPKPKADLWTSTGRRTLVVSQDANLIKSLPPKKTTYATLREALSKAEAGDVIRVAVGAVVAGQPAPAFSEQLDLKGAQLPKNLTIEGFVTEGTEPLVEWRPPSGHADTTPLLSLTDVQGLRLRGFRFEGSNRLHTLLTVSGYCPGLKLEDLHFKGFKFNGVILRNCTGERDEVLALTRVRFTTPPLLKGNAALVVDADPDQTNQEMVVSDSRFEGPCEAAVRFKGSVTYVEFRRNRFYKVDAAFSYAKAEPRHKLRLTLTNNTFVEVFTAIHLEVLPVLDTTNRDNRIVLKNNLFADTAALLRVEEMLAEVTKAKGLFASLAGNVREPSACQEGVFFTEIQPRTFEALPFDPEEDTTFLHYPKGNPLAAWGADGAPVGVPPLEP